MIAFKTNQSYMVGREIKRLQFDVKLVDDILTRKAVNDYGKELKRYVLTASDIKKTVLYYMQKATYIEIDGVKVEEREFAKYAYDQLMNGKRYKEAEIFIPYMVTGWKEEEEILQHTREVAEREQKAA